MLGYYSEMLQGRSKRKLRDANRDQLQHDDVAKCSDESKKAESEVVGADGKCIFLGF